MCGTPHNETGKMAPFLVRQRQHGNRREKIPATNSLRCQGEHDLQDEYRSRCSAHKSLSGSAGRVGCAGGPLGGRHQRMINRWTAVTRHNEPLELALNGPPGLWTERRRDCS